MRTCDEDQGLRDDGDLEVHDHMQLAIVGLDGECFQMNTELSLEEGGLHDDNDKDNPKYN